MRHIVFPSLVYFKGGKTVQAVSERTKHRLPLPEHWGNNPELSVTPEGPDLLSQPSLPEGTKAYSQPWDKHFFSMSWFCPRASSWMDMPKRLPREGSRRRPKQMPKPPQFACLIVKERQLYTDSLLDDWTSQPQERREKRERKRQTQNKEDFLKHCVDLHRGCSLYVAVIYLWHYLQFRKVTEWQLVFVQPQTKARSF